MPVDLPVPHLYFPSLPDLEPVAGFRTIRVNPGWGGEEGQQGIAPLVKDSSANAFAMMVTVGRAANNDVVIPHESVSKFHAFFQERQGLWTYTDADSTNGSIIDGAWLAPLQPAVIPSGATLLLAGKLEGRFLLPEDLYALVQDARVKS